MIKVSSTPYGSPEAFVTFGAVLILHGGVRSQSMHAHRPFELIAALDGAFRLQSSDGSILATDVALVPPLKRHAILEYDGRLARIYVDPGRHRIQTSVDFTRIQSDNLKSALFQKIETLFGLSQTKEDAIALIKLWRSIFIKEIESPPICDRRVVEALDFLDDLAVPDADRVTLANFVGLSPSRFAAVFSADTGMPLRKYIIWRRILLAARLIREKNSVTRAAALAGFSDNAHLTRVYRATFGSPPSELQTITIRQPTSDRKRQTSVI